MSLQDLFAEIDAHHISAPCPGRSAIDEFARKNNYLLPDDVKAFYRRYAWVKLFIGKYGDSTYRFIPIENIHPTRIDIYGIDTDEYGPSSWLTICDVLDGNYIAMDLASKNGNEVNFIDCFHETFARPGESDIIAKSFTELLERALHGGENQLYYLQKGFQGYGDGRPLTAENAAIRIGNPNAPKKGWFARFTFTENGKIYDKFFGDEEYGGQEASFEALRKFIEEIKGNAA